STVIARESPKPARSRQARRSRALEEERDAVLPPRSDPSHLERGDAPETELTPRLAVRLRAGEPLALLEGALHHVGVEPGARGEAEEIPVVLEVGGLRPDAAERRLHEGEALPRAA